MATLWEIDARIRDFPFETDPETGEVLNISDFETLEMERDAKLENIALYWKNLTSDAKAIKEEEAALKKRREALERKADWMKRYLSNSLDGKPFSSPRVAVTFRPSESVHVENAALAIASLKSGGYADALRVKDPEIDKKAVKKLLKDGTSIPGVTLEKTLSAQIK